MFAPQTTGGLSAVPASGGEPRSLTKADVAARERSHRWPAALPGGKAVLFATQLSGSDYDEGIIEAVEVATGKRTVVHKGGAFPRWAPSGHVLFARKGTVYAVPFDAGRLAPAGRPVPVLERVMSSTGGEAPSDGSAQLDVSASGFCAYRTGENETVYRLAVVDRKGTVLKKAAAPRGFSWARFAPDGNRAAVVISSGTQSDVWVYDVARDVFSKLTFEGDDQTVAWSPDGRDVAFTSDRSLGLVTSPGGSPATIRGVYLKRADGTGAPRLLFKMAGTLGVTGFSPDGRTLAFQVTTPAIQLDLGVIRLREGGGRRALDRRRGPRERRGTGSSRRTAAGSRTTPPTAASARSSSGAPRAGTPNGRFPTQMASNPRWARDGNLYYLRRTDGSWRPASPRREALPSSGRRTRSSGSSRTTSAAGSRRGGTSQPDGQRFVVMHARGSREHAGDEPRHPPLEFRGRPRESRAVRRQVMTLAGR